MHGAQFGWVDAEGLAEGGGKISVIREAVFDGKQVEARGGMLKHVLGGVEETQALDVLMEGHARVLFEDAAEMIRRKMHRGRNVFELQRRLDVRVEKGLHLMGLFGMYAECVTPWSLIVGTPAMRGAQDFTHEGDSFLLDGKNVECPPVCTQKFVLQDLQVRFENDVTALE